MNEVRTRVAGRGEQCVEMGDVVSDAGKDRCDDQPGVDSRVHQLAQGAESRRRNGRACLELARQPSVGRNQRDVDLELVALLQPDQQVAVARDERTLGDDAERQSFAARQALQHRPRDAETALGRLIRIGRRPDDDAFADRYALEVELERTDYVFLDEDPLLERFPTVRSAIIRELGVGQLAGVMRALDDVAMCVARVAVAATELTADVRIERPVIHPRYGRRIEHPLGSQRNEPGAAEALVEDGVGQSARLTVGLQQRDLLSHNEPSRTAGTRHTRIAARSWRRSQDREGPLEVLPGVCAPAYTPNITRSM